MSKYFCYNFRFEKHLHIIFKKKYILLLFSLETLENPAVTVRQAQYSCLQARIMMMV